MRKMVALTLVVAAVAIAGAAASVPAAAQQADDKGKVCRMEKQCRWENFKKICVYIKVCR
jgi:ABC-type sugar transport system substrate-binding protein